MANNKQMSESTWMGIILALTGGFLDAYTYISRGNVFANAQTGNIVLLSISIFQDGMKDISKYLIPILAFAIGVFITELIRKKFKNNKLHWRQIIISFEVILLFIVGFIPVSLNNLANIIVSFVCALQVQSFRKINGTVCATTMCTGNLRSGTEALFNYIQSRDKKLIKKSFEYYKVNFMFLIGAGLGTIFTRTLGRKAVIISSFILIVGFLLMFIREEITEPNRGVV